MLRPWRLHSWLIRDDVVKTQLQPPMLAESSKFLRDRGTGVEDRQHMAHPGAAIIRQLGKTADCDRVGKNHCHNPATCWPKPSSCASSRSLRSDLHKPNEASGILKPLYEKLIPERANPSRTLTPLADISAAQESIGLTVVRYQYVERCTVSCIDTTSFRDS